MFYAYVVGAVLSTLGTVINVVLSEEPSLRFGGTLLGGFNVFLLIWAVLRF